MKKNTNNPSKISRLLFIFILIVIKINAQVGIGTKTPDKSAQMEVSSNTKGFLPPRVTKVQRDAIESPANGLLVFCTDCTINGGGCLSQNIGSPSSPNWECIGASSSPSMVATCNGFVSGTYISGIATNGSYTVTITNNSFSTATISFSSSDIVLSGVTGLVVGTPTSSPSLSSGTISLVAGASVVVTYPITGTPTSSGTLTGTWSKISLSCAKTKNVTLGGANFASNTNTYVFSVNDISLSPAVVQQGTLPIGTTINVPYTSGIGSYSSYTSPFVAIPSIYCEDGASDWTFGYAYNAGTFSSSGNIPVTLITKKAGVVSVWNAKRVLSVQTINFNCVSLPWVNNGNTYNNTIGIDEGGDAIRGALALGGCASCLAYDNANVNDVIQVTLAEFNKLNDIIIGISNFGRKSTDNFITPGAAGFTDRMFKNNITEGAYPFAFSTLLDGANSGVKLIKQLSNSTGGASSLDYNSGNCKLMSGQSTGVYYFVMKRPDVPMPANTNIAVKGFWNGWGDSGSNSCEGCTTSVPSFTNIAGNSQNCSNTNGLVSSLSSGTSPTNVWLNYNIKWTVNKQW